MKLQKFDVIDKDNNPLYVQYRFWCPGCEEIHTYRVGAKDRPTWTFDGNMEKPTFTPSLLYPSKPVRCHLFVTNGQIIYCADSQHKLAGKTVDLPDIPEEFIIKTEEK
jgi:hypothetical protein